MMTMILKADNTNVINGVKINEYMLTNHNPNNIDMPSASMEGKVIGVTIHNTDWITTIAGTTPAEQYTRATVNGNMKDVRVHYYCDDTCAWQNLPLTLSGWHAADGDGSGNRRTIAIECIMSPEYTDIDKKSEDNCARLAAALLKMYGLSIDNLYTHTYWLNVRDGRKGSNDELNVMHNSYKMCPIYILPHWIEFKAKVMGYMGGPTPAPKPKKAANKVLYRVRKTWKDAKSQVGAFEVLDNALKACPVGYTVYDNSGTPISKKEVELRKGSRISLMNTPLYMSADAKEPSNTVNGTYFIYDGMNFNGRMRITNAPEKCGNTPVGFYVTGYINIDDM